MFVSVLTNVHRGGVAACARAVCEGRRSGWFDQALGRMVVEGFSAVSLLRGR